MIIDDVRTVVGNALQIGVQVESMDATSALLGVVPEMDSMAVITIITALEERFGITVADDEIGATTFETLGSLSSFVEQKLSG